MWTFDQNTCMNCQKLAICPDAKLIQAALRALLDGVDENEGGSAAGVIVVVCKDPDR